jgi:acyl-CoA dehydrogenase
MPDTGVVCFGEYEGRRVLGIRLNFSKRWITLAPVATVVGLAFRLRDPEALLGDRSKSDYGITCALIPAAHAGVEIGRRHYPGAAFMNGPIFGHDVFIPVEWIIGGPAMAGHGWRMLVECLSAGRGISLPALATAAAQSAYRMTGAFARIRRQFRLAIGQFEGVQEATGRIAGLSYTLEAMRRLTASAVDHCAPSVVTAIAKYHMTEMMRRVLLDAMDVFAGRGVQMGPRNPLATGYRAIPIGITVEGANILTRNLMIFGQGGIRCHEYVFAEMQAAKANDLKAFDRLLFKHIGFTVNRGTRAFTLGLFGAQFARAPLSGTTAHYFRELTRLSAALAFSADLTMLTLGGELKRKERLSARLGDVLSQLYIGSAVLKFFIANGQPEDEEGLMRWAMEHVLYQVREAFAGLYENFPSRGVAGVMRAVCFPWGVRVPPLSDALNAQVADQLLERGELRDRLTSLVYVNGGRHDPVGRIEHAFELLQEAEPAYLKYAKLQAEGALSGDGLSARLKDAVTRDLLTREEADRIKAYDEARYDAILTDDFDPAYLVGERRRGRAEVVDLAATRERVA